MRGATTVLWVLVHCSGNVSCLPSFLNKQVLGGIQSPLCCLRANLGTLCSMAVSDGQTRHKQDIPVTSNHDEGVDCSASVSTLGNASDRVDKASQPPAITILCPQPGQGGQSWCIDLELSHQRTGGQHGSGISATPFQEMFRGLCPRMECFGILAGQHSLRSSALPLALKKADKKVLFIFILIVPARRL